MLLVVTLAFSVTVDNWQVTMAEAEQQPQVTQKERVRTLTITSCPTKIRVCRQKEPCGDIGMLHREQLSQ